MSSWRVELYDPNDLVPVLAVIGPESGPLIIGLPGDRDNDAVANLVAAAPDLLEALEELVAQSLDSGHPHDWLRHEIDQAKAAIAKAKGEQP